MRSFLGLTGYYRRFVPQYTTVAAPLTQLTTKEYQNKFSWTEECNKSFKKLKDLLCSASVLSYPNFKHEFILQTDSSDVGEGAILSQYDEDGIEHVIAYSSKALSPREQNYSTTEKEAFAIQFGTQHFRVYLVERKFTIITDHNALKWLNQIEPKGRVARWLMDLQEFDFIFKYRPGRVHDNADALSRLLPYQHQVNSKSSADISAVTLCPDINIKDAQEQDPCLAKLREWKANGLRNAPKVKMLRFYNRLFLRDGILGARQHHPHYVVVVPQSLTRNIVRAMHDNPFARHMGIARTEDRIRQRFFWPGIRRSVQEYIKQCAACTQRKTATDNNKAPQQTIEVGEPFTFWAMDYMGPLPETSRGNRHILVAIDHFSKWCKAFPTKDQKATTVSNILINKVFSGFGPPVVLHSDQGANFESNLLHEICDLMGIAKTRTTGPQCDGQVERQNRTLQDMLAAFASQHRDDRDLWIDPVVFA